MRKFKTVFVACLGLEIAAGAGYYLYKKFLGKDGEEDSSSAQVKLGNFIIIPERFSTNRKTSTNFLSFPP